MESNPRKNAKTTPSMEQSHTDRKRTADQPEKLSDQVVTILDLSNTALGVVFALLGLNSILYFLRPSRS